MSPKPKHECPSAIPLERVDTLGYIAHDYELKELAQRLKRHGYRGAICGPDGSGKSVMLQALGDELLSHGLSPLTLCLKPHHAQTLPASWRRTIRKARHTDALLIDGYGLLPWWARAWVWVASMRAGAVIITAQQRDLRFKTLAQPKPTVSLLKTLTEQLAPAFVDQIDYAHLFEQCDGNLREALRSVCHFTAESDDSGVLTKKKAS